MATVPARARGTVMLAMNVGQKRRRKRKMTITTSEILSKSENWTSATEARIVAVRSLSWEIFMEGGIHLVSCGSVARMIFFRIEKLVVAGDGISIAVAIQAALGQIHIDLAEEGSHLFETETGRSQGPGIDLDADG